LVLKPQSYHIGFNIGLNINEGKMYSGGFLTEDYVIDVYLRSLPSKYKVKSHNMTAILVTSGVNYRFLRVPIFLAKIVIIGNFFDKFFCL
jgi:hypothetical protein